MKSLVAAVVCLALFAAAGSASAAQPVAGGSYLIKSRGFDDDDRGGWFTNDNVLSVTTASASRFGDSASASVPAEPDGVPNLRSLPSVIEVYPRCLGAGFSYTGYTLNGLPIKPDGTFATDVRNHPSDGWGGTKTYRSEFHLRGRFDTPTSVSGQFWEVRYLRVRDRHGSKTIRYCQTGTGKTRPRQTFHGTLRPIQWIVDKSCLIPGCVY